MKPRVLLSHSALNHTLNRLAFQVYERHTEFSRLCLVALQPRGVFLGRRIAEKLEKFIGERTFEYGELDVTFYRDDFRRRSNVLVPSSTHMDFSLEGKNIVLVDDVLYTGRTVRSGLDALLDFGRPASVELLVLIDRRFSRELPVQPDYTGRTVDVVRDETVKVIWSDDDSNNQVTLFKPEK
ncbi:MAG: bifunctional pyr operon transcriptional regulator/uracil phosphoribosyltransferase PyrR [Salibacteraceae bacterium]